MLQKQDINDSKLFFKLEIGTIETVLGELKPKGKKIEVLNAIKKVKQKYEKEGFIFYMKESMAADSIL